MPAILCAMTHGLMPPVTDQSNPSTINCAAYEAGSGCNRPIRRPSFPMMRTQMKFHEILHTTLNRASSLAQSQRSMGGIAAKYLFGYM
jgi:hypothetical protein